MAGIKIIVGLALLLVGAEESVAGAWAQPKGGYFAKVSGIAYQAEEVFNDMGKRAPMGLDDNRFSARQTFVYGEYGWRDQLTLVGQFAASHLVAEDRLIESTTWGLGDVQLAAKYQWTEGKVVLAPLVEVKVPTGYDPDYVPALGTGELDGGVKLLAGSSLYPLPLYLGAEIGYALRGGPFSNQWSYALEIGGTPHERLFAKLFWGGVYTLSDAAANAGAVGVVQVSEGDFGKVGLNASVALFGPVWLDVLWEGIVNGENIGAGSSWGLGLALIR